MSAPPVTLRRSARNSAKRTSPTAEASAAAAPEAVAPATKKKRTTPATSKDVEEKPKKEKKLAADKKGPVEKKAPAVKKAAATVKKAVAAVVPAAAPSDEKKETPAEEEPAAASAAASAPAAAAATPTATELKEGDSIPDELPEIQTHTGETTTLGALIAASEKGIVIFAYPKASTPGCITQACAFRDSTAEFSGLGYAIYGLSGDSPSANEKFYTKQNLADIKLLCDPKYELHARLGVKKAGAAKATVRSVVVIKKGVDGAKATVIKKTPANPAQSVDYALKAINAAASNDKEGQDAEMKD